MGHYISVFTKENNIDEVTCLVIAASNFIAQYLFYESMNAQEYNGGCSGNGEEKVFAKKEIEIAKAKLKYISTDDNIKYDIQRYSNDEKHDYFKDCIEKLSGNPSEVLTEVLSGEIDFEVERINGFFDQILQNKDEEVILWFG